MTSEFNIAIHALVFLSHKEINIPSEELAKNICTNPARVRKIMAKLKKAGLIETKEGSDGGYFFNKDTKNVTLNEIGQALEITYVSASWHSGDTDKKCLIASGMADVMDEIYTQMSNTCANYLETISLNDIDQKIFYRK